MATHSSVLAWRIPGTGEPDGLPSMGSQSWTLLKATQQQQQQPTGHAYFSVPHHQTPLLTNISAFSLFDYKSIHSQLLNITIMLETCCEGLPLLKYEQETMRNFPGSSVVKIPCFHCRGHRFNLWSWNLASQLGQKQTNEKNMKP